MSAIVKTAILGSFLALGGIAWAVTTPGCEETTDPAVPITTEDREHGPDPAVTGGPGNVVPDLFHPRREEAAEPRRGGRAIVHISVMPRHFNYMTEHSAVSRYVLRECHETLLQRDWETWQWTSYLTEDGSWLEEDTVLLKNDETFFGRTSVEDGKLHVEPLSPGNPLTEARTWDLEEVTEVRRGTVFTFHFPDNVLWHDGHPFDAHDVYFSWRCYFNPTVDCEDDREKVQRLEQAVVIDDRTIRFHYNEQYSLSRQAFEDVTLLPAHVFDLSDPDNPEHQPDIDPLGRDQGEFINDHRANRHWIGLGAYRITEVNEQYIEAERFEDYYNPKRGGWLDVVRWRHISNDDAAKAALLNGELDYFERLRSEDYLGAFASSETFTESLYKGYLYLPRMQYIAWNMRRPPFDSKEVRQAMAHSFDWEEFIRTQANGLGVRITSTQPYLHPNYDHSVVPIPFDLEKAAELLDDAGWYDRDGDGIRDKDGRAFEFEFLMTPGNKAAEPVALKLQENLAQIGVKLNIETRDWAVAKEQTRQKDFDSFPRAWVLDVENDPIQLWGSYQGPPGEDRTANYPGVADPEVDRLIEAFQLEVDDSKRPAIARELHRRLYDMQPYMFTYNVPVKFAVSQRVRNFKSYGMNPGYSVRDWFLVE